MPDRQLASQPDLLDPEAERRILRCSSVNPFLPFNVADPDPYVFEPRGSGSISTKYGSGSGYDFFHQAKIVRKTVIPNVL
jgi:hypothetical protein